MPGAATVAANAGVDLAVAARALSAFDTEYPGIARFADHVSRLREIVTPLGRRLPLNRDRSYIGINYYIQSAARDIFVQAMFRLVAAGLMDHLWLPVHDEIIVSVRDADTWEVARVMEAIMASEFMGVPITANATILGERWHEKPAALALQQTFIREVVVAWWWRYRINSDLVAEHHGSPDTAESKVDKHQAQRRHFMGEVPSRRGRGSSRTVKEISALGNSRGEGLTLLSAYTHTAGDPEQGAASDCADRVFRSAIPQCSPSSPVAWSD